jgi:pimeloyl-ACP methyl ester carboxylesterase
MRRFIALIGAAVLALSGCTPAIQGPTPITDSTISSSVKKYYEQVVNWKSCGSEGAVCGSVTVPMDWSKPQAKTLELAVAYRPADIAKPLGSVIFNPGGPGASGVTWITDSPGDLATAQLRKNFNMVGFDPRGVGQSDPKVSCLDAAQTDELLYGDSGLELGSVADLADTRANLKRFIEACVKNTPDGLAFIDTVSTAKDLDVLRAIFGDEKLNYLGFSYGTLIGATYANLFPQRVGKLVLDGAIDPTVSDEVQNLAQLAGFDLALRNYLADCLSSSDCPFTGTVSSALRQIQKLLLSIEKKPLATLEDRELTIWGATTGLIMPLYSADYWPALSQAFEEALSGDGTTFLQLADAYNDRNEDGSYASNLMEANLAVSCLDSRSSSKMSDMLAQNKALLKVSPTLGRYWMFGGLTCEQWPYKLAAKPLSYDAPTANTILVIGTTGDPATPYEQAVALANSVLANAQLITFNGEGHTAYGQENKCVNDAVDQYFIKNVVPSEDPEC